MKPKWIFAALVLINLGLWMWASWYKELPVSENSVARLPIAPEKMRLLDEAGVKLQLRKVPPAANSQLVATASSGCFRLGPFPDAELTAKAETKLKEWHLSFIRQTEQTNPITGYRVYLAPFASKQAAERKRKRLTRLGFKDHALILEEGSQNAISLGLFSVQANADSRVRDLAAKGVKAKVRPLRETRTLYWLDFPALVPVETVVKLKQTDWGAKEIQVQQKACPAGVNPLPATPHPPPDKTLR